MMSVRSYRSLMFFHMTPGDAFCQHTRNDISSYEPCQWFVTGFLMFSYTQFVGNKIICLDPEDAPVYTNIYCSI